MTIESFLGKDNLERFKNLYPLIRVLFYRLDIDGKTGLCNEKPHSIRERGLFVFRIIKYYWLMWKAQDRTDEKILLSETIIRSNRYEEFIRLACQDYSLCVSKTISTCSILEKKMGEELKSISSIFFGYSVSGKNVEKIVNMMFDTCQSFRDCNVNFDIRERELSRQLTKLNKAWEKRVDYLSRLLLKQNVKLFITANQSNLADVILISACRKAGIWTKEMCHHSWCAMEKDYRWRMFNSISTDYFDDNIRPYYLVNESCQWNDAEISICKNHYNFENLFGDEVIYSNIGCPEIIENQRIEYMKKYPKSDVLLVLAPVYTLLLGSVDKEKTTEDLERLAKWREKIYRNISDYAHERGMKVLLRYHPSEPPNYIIAETNILLGLGIEMTSTSREDLMRCLAMSRVVVGNNSSALILALSFGCKVYCLKSEKEDFDYGDLNVSLVDMNTMKVEDDNRKDYLLQSGLLIDALLSY